MAASKPAKPLPRIRHLHELYSRCTAGEPRYLAWAAGAVQNFGMERLLRDATPGQCAATTVLADYHCSLVQEYGMGEAEAEKEIVAELNGIRDLF